MDERWEDVPLIPSAEGYAQVPFNGWFLLLAWAAGSSHLGRMPGSLNEALPGSLNEALPAGEELLEDDSEWIVEMANDYLVLAGVPPVPEGYIWYLQLPPGIRSAEELWDRIGVLLDDALSRMPQRDGEEHTRALLPVVTGCLAELY
ncbi:hypothetical protein H9639_04590 [Arthrobacter sp. Sa2CUA1]|uniref:Uncharacterized protein n=1 Tax=Arthrobacter gallicola TaxID=2762225 RepID=A0ABR8UPV0_9MICC|nr:DUF5956 family protein [Arthrobacter gallicola]MBD7994569.1 hypothetical protein [Arthrobacter gallicola]